MKYVDDGKNKNKRKILHTCRRPKVDLSSSSELMRGRREGGHLGSAKKFKTPFFQQYFKILSRGYSNGSRTLPIFFFLKYLNNYCC